MPGTPLTDHARYLEAKRSVEDRSLNLRVWHSLTAWVRDQPSGELEVLEVGAGTGAMLIRLLEGGIFRDASYLALDQDRDSLHRAKENVFRWARSGPYSAEETGGDQLLLALDTGRVRVEFVNADIEAYLDLQPAGRRWGLIVAHAVLDLLDLATVLPRLLGCLSPGGGYYFPINFDGVTVFEPVLDRPLDSEIYRCYHQTMDQRVIRGKRSGESETGRRLLGFLAARPGRVVEAGSSDWVVFPHQGAYPADEAFFLCHILSTMETALVGHPDLDPRRLQEWMSQRRAQVEAGELVFIAHQIDVFGLR